MALTIGDKAPDFTLQTDAETNVTLSKLHGKKVVLYFYPKDNTPGCTKEACDFRDNLRHLKNMALKYLAYPKIAPRHIQNSKKNMHLPFHVARG